MTKAAHKDFTVGDLVTWSGHVTGLTEMTAVFGIVIALSEETIEVETPAVFRGEGHKPYIVSVNRKYSRALFGRLSPRILQKCV